MASVFEDSLSIARLPITPPKSVVAEAVRMMLSQSHYWELRQIECEARGGVVSLYGEVSSFYLKQLAQIAAGKVLGVVRVDNCLEVLDSSASRH